MRINISMPLKFIEIGKKQANERGLSLSAYIRTLFLEKEK